jgi:hypothetical protein
MSTHARTSNPTDRSPPPWAAERLVLGGLLMLVTGAWAMLMGVSALFTDAIYDPPPDYVYGLDLSVWAWGQLALGVLTAAGGAWVMRGGMLARVVAVAILVLGMLVGFLFAPYHAVWSVLGLVLDLIIIWALTAGQRIS